MAYNLGKKLYDGVATPKHVAAPTVTKMKKTPKIDSKANSTLKVKTLNTDKTLKTNTNTVTKAVTKMASIEKAKVDARAKIAEKTIAKRKEADRRFEVLPSMIRSGIAGYFDKNKLRMDLKTGEVSVLPLGANDVASKV